MHRNSTVLSANQILMGASTDAEMQDGVEGHSRQAYNSSKKRQIQGYLTSKRTDRVFEVAVPAATQLQDLACRPIMFECASEFPNFIQISLEGVKFCRLIWDASNEAIEFPAQVVDGFNNRVLYVK